MYHAVLIRKLRNMDRDTLYYITGVENFVSYKIKTSVNIGVSLWEKEFGNKSQ
jgi:hypothetical protein